MEQEHHLFVPTSHLNGLKQASPLRKGYQHSGMTTARAQHGHHSGPTFRVQGTDINTAMQLRRLWDPGYQ